MTKDKALENLTRLKPELVERFGVTCLALFGSTVNYIHIYLFNIH